MAYFSFSMNCFKILISFLVLYFTSVSGQNKEFLLVNSPEKLVIYNQFEQTMTETAKKRLGENTPFMITDLRGFLSDGLTPVIEAVYLKEKLFILRDEKGNPAISGKAAVKKTGSVTPYNNQGVIKNDCRGETFSGKKINLKKGERVIASFTDGDKIYAGVNTGSNPIFLFVSKKDFAEENNGRPAGTKLKSFSQDHLRKVNELSARYNKIFIAVYKFAGNEFDKEKPAPEVTVTSSSGEIKIIIKNYDDAHRRSLEEFYTAAENILSDCDYQKSGNIENISFRIKK